MSSLKASSPVFSLHSRQFRTAQVQTRRRHWRRIPPEDMFFSASRSAKLSEDAKIRTSAITTSLWRKEMATSMGIPWVGSSTSNSFWKKKDNGRVKSQKFRVLKEIQNTDKWIGKLSDLQVCKSQKPKFQKMKEKKLTLLQWYHLA